MDSLLWSICPAPQHQVWSSATSLCARDDKRIPVLRRGDGAAATAEHSNTSPVTVAGHRAAAAALPNMQHIGFITDDHQELLQRGKFNETTINPHFTWFQTISVEISNVRAESYGSA